MNINKWHAALTIALVIVSAGLAGSCGLTATPQDALPTAPSDSEISASSAETADTTGSSAASATPSDETVIGVDPVSGRSEQVDLRWQELCLSSLYQVQIAKDPGFSIIVIDTGTYHTGVYYPAGGQAHSPSALAPWSGLEAGHTYYWRARVRQAATGQYMRSPWSEAGSFTVGAGLPISASSYGPQPLYPNNGSINCPVKPASFTWSPLNDTTSYKFVLARDAAMTQVVKEAKVATTAYEYDGELEYSESYFWRVTALEPAPGDWSNTFTFQTEAAPPPAPAGPAPKPTPLWVWPFISVGGILIIVLIVLLARELRK